MASIWQWTYDKYVTDGSTVKSGFSIISLCCAMELLGFIFSAWHNLFNFQESSAYTWWLLFDEAERYRISLERDIQGSLLSNLFLPLSYRTILIKRIHLSFMYENYHLYRRMHIYTFVWGNQKVLYKLIPQNILICYPKKDGKSLIKFSTNNLEKGLQVSWYTG